MHGSRQLFAPLPPVQILNANLKWLQKVGAKSRSEEYSKGKSEHNGMNCILIKTYLQSVGIRELRAFLSLTFSPCKILTVSLSSRTATCRSKAYIRIGLATLKRAFISVQVGVSRPNTLNHLRSTSPLTTTCANMYSVATRLFSHSKEIDCLLLQTSVDLGLITSKGKEVLHVLGLEAI